MASGLVWGSVWVSPDGDNMRWARQGCVEDVRLRGRGSRGGYPTPGRGPNGRSFSIQNAFHVPRLRGVPSEPRATTSGEVIGMG